MTNPFENTEANRIKTEKETELSFQGFMKRPEVRMLMSMIPQTEPPELLTTLLRAAHSTGSDNGRGSVLVEFAKAVVERKS